MTELCNRFEEQTVLHDDDSDDEEICDTCGKTIMTDDEGEKCGEGCEEYDRGLEDTREEREKGRECYNGEKCKPDEFGHCIVCCECKECIKEDDELETVS